MDAHDALAMLLAARDEPAIKALSEYQKAESLVESDPVLRAAYKAEEAYYAAYGDLLAGVRLTEAARADMQAQVHAALAMRDAAPEPLRIWPMRHPALAMAAAVLAMAAGVLLLTNSFPMQPSPILAARADMDSFEEFAAAIVAAGIQLDHHDSRPGALLQWLQRERGMQIDNLSPGLMALKSMGCRVYDWNGSQVALLCMETADGQMAHLFITQRENLDLSTVGTQLGCNSCDDREVFSWVDGNLACVMVAHQKGQRLNPFNGLSG